ncbi:MAG: hypothetical protein ISR91_05865 [Candidatus Delongbacteria bacterium]|nr:hypothetical protein [Candidatus Delongbacteria bacterium]
MRTVKKTFVHIMAGLFLLSLLNLTACTKYAKDDDLKQLSEQKAAAEGAERELEVKRAEQRQLEQELAAKRAELQEVAKTRDEVLKNAGQ